LTFYYGADGLTGFHIKSTNAKYNDENLEHDFYYKKTLQGDIIGIIDSNGEEIVKYVYDAWGNHKAYNAKTGDLLDNSSVESYTNTSNMAQFIAIKNPFRYRGYYYDIETGLYYLNSRYYDPEIGRFINADDIGYLDLESINGLNLYAYCINNPVNLCDETGCAWWDWLISGLQIVVGAVLVATGVGAGFGAMLIAGGTIGLISNAVGSAIGGGIGSVVNGGGAISTGISLFSYGPIGIIAGIGLIAVGAATAIMGTNEIARGITGHNYIQEWTGMSDSLYNGLYLGFNLASSIGTIAARLGMRSISTLNGRVAGNAKPYANITEGYKTVQYDGRGRLYWSIHRTNHDKFWISNPHWHTGAGRDGNHYNSYLRLLIKLIFRR